MNEHYVYLYIDPRNGVPFYVGCGKNKRMFVHLLPSRRIVKSEKTLLIDEIFDAGLHPMIVVIEWGLTQIEALNRERIWIAFFGKHNLTNKTTGGQGCPGCSALLGKHLTDKTKERMRESKIGSKNPMFGKQRSAEALRKFVLKVSGSNHHGWGKHRSAETKDKISSKLVGHKWSEEDCDKRSVGMQKVWETRKKTGVGLPCHPCKMISCGSQNMTIDDWSEKTGIPKGTIVARIRRGWKIEEVLGLE